MYNGHKLLEIIMSRNRSTDKFTLVGNTYVNVPLFLSKSKQDENGCLIWQPTCRHKQNYGFFGVWGAPNYSRKMVLAHRLSVMIRENRELDKKEWVIHSCGNSLCTNPHHLIIGTHVEKFAVMRKYNKFNNENKGPKRGGVTEPQKRNYKYSADDVRWLRTAGIDEVAAKYPHLTRPQAIRLRWAAKLGYKWVV